MKHLLILSFALFSSTLIQAQHGILDVTFDTDGIVTTDLNNNRDVAKAILEQPDGKILVAGYTEDQALNHIIVLRYNADGSMDNSFGTNGVVTTLFPGNGNSLAYDMALQPDGKIIVVGHTFLNNENQFAAVRYSSNGDLDAPFGTGGIATVAIPGFGATVSSVELQDDGKIVIGGQVNNVQWDGFAFAMVRMNADGTTDNSFGTAGIVTTDLIPGGGLASLEGIRDLAIQADGKIVAAGYSAQDAAIVRYTTSGLIDSTFGISGIYRINYTQTGNTVVNAVQVQPNDKLLFAGFVATSYSDMLLFRLLDDGSLDQNFGASGTVITTVSAMQDGANAVEVQSDGKIVIAGSAIVNSINHFALVRYESDGSLDPTFGTNGQVDTQVDPTYSAIEAMTIQANGKIVTAGTSRSDTADVALARYTSGITTDVYEPIRFGQFKVYPNITSGIFNIEIEDHTALKLEVLDISGKTVLDLSPTQRTVDVSHLSDGLYFVRLTTTSDQETLRLFKQ